VGRETDRSSGSLDLDTHLFCRLYPVAGKGRDAETSAVSAVGIAIGRVIRSHREGRKLSQESLAELARLNRTYLGEIERGAAIPSLETLQKLADALGEPLFELIRQYEIIYKEDS
jgi:XRE family transcriptional regulator, regulator of sulfur utilization